MAEEQADDDRAPLGDQLWLAVADVLRASPCQADGTDAAAVVRAVLPVLADELRWIADDLASWAHRVRVDLPPQGAISWLDQADVGRVIQAEDDVRMLQRRADELDVLASSSPAPQRPERPETD